MKRTQIKRPVKRTSRGGPEENNAEMMPLTAREFLKLSAVPRVSSLTPGPRRHDPNHSSH